MTRLRCAIGFALAVALMAPPAAHGAIFNVNSGPDAGDPAAGDGNCDADPLQAGLQCTIRAAINEAGSPSSPGLDVILIPAGTYTLNSPNELVVDSPLIIDGAMAATTIVRQEINGRVIEVTAGDSLDLRDVTITGGAIAGPGGGIHSLGTLIVRRSIVRGNQAIGARGGGIMSDTGGSLTVENSVIGGTTPAHANQAGEFGGGLYAENGLVMRNSAVIGNGFDGTAVSSEGAGLQSFGPTTISDSTISGNGDADTDGSGGMGLSFTPAVTVTDTTISGNRAGLVGSGLGVRETVATLRNVTITENTSTAGNTFNSALFVQDGSLVAQHVTIADNPFSQGQALFAFTSSGSETVTATLRASIVDGGSRPACGSAGPGAETLASGGFNLVDGGGCPFTAPGDVGADPRLGSLANNGGPTRTMALSRTSPARNRVSSGCPGPGADQRGVPRPQGPRCDSGAYELARCRGTVVNRVGTTGKDVVNGSSRADGFLLFGGRDVAKAKAGNDRACGGPGRDRLIGGRGRDLLLGEAGADLLLGGAGRDRLIGGAGRDRLRGGGGTDRLVGGPGQDLQVQ